MSNPYRVSVIPGGHPWDAVRNNQLIQTFLDSDADIFVKMDVDQKYPSDYLTKMVPLVKKYKVIGALLFDRWIENRFMPLLIKQHYMGKLVKHIPEKWTGIQEIPYTHTNLFYAREVLEAISSIRPWYDPHIRPDGLERMNHLDYTFLDKIKRAGYKIYTNFDVVIEHLTVLPVSKEVFLKFNMEDKE